MTRTDDPRSYGSSGDAEFALARHAVNDMNAPASAPCAQQHSVSLRAIGGMRVS